jgi:hypothetical protein
MRKGKIMCESENLELYERAIAIRKEILKLTYEASSRSSWGLTFNS